MLLPSGEKATEDTLLLCALCFSALSSREAAAGRGAVSFGLRVQGYQCPRTRIPHFERLVVRARDDGLAVGREGHGVHRAAVRALLARYELERACQATEGGVRSGQSGVSFSPPATPPPLTWGHAGIAARRRVSAHRVNRHGVARRARATRFLLRGEKTPPEVG